MTRTNDEGERETQAAARDHAASDRDHEAALRDLVADAADAQIDSQRVVVASLPNGIGDGSHPAPDGERAAADRDDAEAQRAAAARDRVLAASDRKLAAHDRTRAAADLAAAGIDELTGALRRGVGLTSIEREIARAHRMHEPLVLAYVDVDRLKRVNDTLGHTAGDRLLQRAVDLIRTHLRPYDVTVRVGGDEFVCSLYGVRSANVQARFRQVGDDLAAGPGGGSVSVGLAELEPSDTLDDLIRRADAALLAGRGPSRRSLRFRRSRRPVVR